MRKIAVGNGKHTHKDCDDGLSKGNVHSDAKCTDQCAAVRCEQGEKGTAHPYIMTETDYEKTKTGTKHHG